MNESGSDESDDNLLRFKCGIQDWLVALSPTVFMQLEFMEQLLRMEAEAKYFLGATDRSYEQELMDELSKIIKLAELQLGPRNRSYELLPPRISECGCAHPYIYPFKKIRIYLTSGSTNRSVAARQLSHEVVHVLGPTASWATVLEEGLGECFSREYMKLIYGEPFRSPNRWYEAAMNAVAPLLARNKFVIKELRERQPLISKIDEKLLVEVAGIEPGHARLLCANFDSSWITASSWSEYSERGAELFAKGFRSFWDSWKSA